MAWTAPMTAVANTAFTAAQFNIHVRDNLNETAPAKATTAGRIFVTTGANSIAERAITENVITTGESTASGTYVDLTTVGPSVTITTGTEAILWIGCGMSNSTTAGGAMAFAISGATTTAPADANSYGYQSAASAGGRSAWIGKVTLTAGSNTFTAKYRVNGGTGFFDTRRLGIIAL